MLSSYQHSVGGGRLGPRAERLKKRATKGTASGWIFKTGGCGELGGIGPGGEGRGAAAFWGLRTEDGGGKVNTERHHLLEDVSNVDTVDQDSKVFIVVSEGRHQNTSACR